MKDEFKTIDDLIVKLYEGNDRRKSLDTGIELANEIMKIIIPSDSPWISDLKVGEDILDRVISNQLFPNQKVNLWFVDHPYFIGFQVALRLFNVSEAHFESKFYWMNSNNSKEKIAAATKLFANWEGYKSYKHPNYKVGIDFMLSKDCKSLFVVLSKYDNFRVLELNEKLTNIQRRILSKIENSGGIKSSNEEVVQKTLHTILWDAFSLSEVTKSFYKGIVDHFDLLSNELIFNKINKKTIEDAKVFSLRLVSRFLFCWFLRKKEFLDSSQNYFDIGGFSSSEFYEKKIKVLFFKTLNTPIPNRTNGDKSTAYLDCGLFEPHNNDWVEEYLEFPFGWFESLIVHFNDYNFTTYESSSDYEQVAVDPDMVGKILEQLLSDRINGNGKDERKINGADYIPREIVDFMCKDSLRNSLYNEYSSPYIRWGLNDLFYLPDYDYTRKHSNAKRDLFGVSGEFVIKHYLQILDELRVLDPACGSGAYPLVVLKVLEKTYKRLKGKMDNYDLKLQIIENNIYGVDIDPMSIEISKLRCWLSLVIEEKNAKDVRKLPNLDFKFVCADSLKSKVLQNSVDENKVGAFNEMNIIRKNYFNEHNPILKEEMILRFNLLKNGLSDFEDLSALYKQWSPKQEYAARFFDSNVMLGVQGGFGMILGNPPHIQLDSNKLNLIKYYENDGYNVFDKTCDLYYLFYENTLRLLKEGGVGCLLTSNKWLKDENGKKLRNYLYDNSNPILLVDLADGIYDLESEDWNILFFNKSLNLFKTEGISIKKRIETDLNDIVKTESRDLKLSKDEIWNI